MISEVGAAGGVSFILVFCSLNPELSGEREREGKRGVYLKCIILKVKINSRVKWEDLFSLDMFIYLRY